MLSHPTVDRLRELGLIGMVHALEEQRRQPDSNDLGFEDRLAMLVDREVLERDNKRLKARLRFAGLRQVPGQPPGTFTLSSEAEARDRVQEVRRQAGGRRYRSEALLQAVVLGKDPETAAAAIAAGSPALTVDLVLGSPFVLLARDAQSAAAELLRRRADLGFESFTTHQANLEALGEVIAAVRGAGSA